MGSKFNDENSNNFASTTDFNSSIKLEKDKNLFLQEVKKILIYLKYIFRKIENILLFVVLLVTLSTT
jgi:hypothetical protein